MTARYQRMLDLIEHAKDVPAFTKYSAAEHLSCSIPQAMRAIMDARRHLGLEDEANIAYLSHEHVYSLIANWDEAHPHIARRRATQESNQETDLAFVRSQIRNLQPSDPRWIEASLTIADYEASLQRASAIRRHLEATA